MTILMQRNLTDSKITKSDDICIDVFIPGYTSEEKALVVKIELMVLKRLNFSVSSQGIIAFSLERIFKRNIEIMSSLKKSYEVLKNFEYRLISTGNNWSVKDARSAGLPICIALINVVRKLNGLEQVQSINGTGILRIDGTFEKSHLEEEKRKASSELMENRFINSEVCKNVFNLATLMNGQ
ncbi:hypothetical protein [Legionella yabuuchiae]|uniref:hypothetical protein n=1 Tax=Legionella yabuuchiae TaxID=376727 RepID=UPI00105563EF|nr:hypothetical protein [Legionella yabuuchiae]